MRNYVFAALLAGLLSTFAWQQLAQAQKADPKEPPPVEVDEAEGGKVRDKALEEQMPTLRNHARVRYAKTGSAPTKLTGMDGCNAKEEELKTDKSKVHDRIYLNGRDKALLVAEPLKEGDRFHALAFTWAAGGDEIKSYSSFEAIKEAFEGYDFGEEVAAEADDSSDPYRLYKKEGRKWTHEIAGGMKMTTEVVKATKESATISTTIFTAAGDRIGEPSEYEIEFAVPEVDDDAPQPEPPKSIEERIKSKAGEFDCISYDEGKTWMSKKYPGLIVKAEMMELVEFTE